jgi:hypothetical protein
MSESNGTHRPAGEFTANDKLDPAKFMRARRPELFSDSEPERRPLLTRELLEYHLDTLTSRKQEIEFEYFCRKLAEKEICPNLRPQTGPTGGGDSKVDAETIPVSTEISTLWVGANPAAGDERWAFAFSAKKDWKTKVRLDVEGIIGTNRGYKRIYFITNQFAPDKARAKLEDGFVKKYGVSVFILDRSWIIKSIIEHDRIQLAVDALGLTGLSSQTEKKVGPRDVARQQELTELETEINDSSRYDGAQYQLAEDCLRAALLARGLEKPRTEVDGYFSRAERVADQVGHKQQRLRIAYERAWGSFWWYGDFNELNRLYDVVEGYAAGTNRADDTELVLNLWQVLGTTIRRGALDANTAKIEERTTKLKNELDRLASDASRPNNALHARTDRLLVSLYEAFESNNQDNVDAVWVGFSKVVTDAEHLGDYPFERFFKLIEVLGEVVTDSAAFDGLFENVVRVLQSRRSEGEGGLALLERGFQKLKADNVYDAIRLFGRAQESFIKREYREALVSSLAGCSIAYEQAGLLWAARNCALTAAERCLAFYWEDGTIVRPVLSVLQKLIWLELQLGRIPRLLEVLELAVVITPQLKLDNDRIERLKKERSTQDIILGLLLLKSSIKQLQHMRTLPDVLEGFELFHSKMALLYALSCEHELRDEGFIPKSESTESVNEFFHQWLKQPAVKQVPEYPNLMIGDEIEFQSNVLGCQILTSVANNKISIYLAEALLGALEAFLATSLGLHIAPYRQSARIIVQPSSAITGPPETSIRDIDGESVFEVLHSATQPTQSNQVRTAYQNSLKSAIVKIISHFAIIDDVDAYLDRVAGEEKAFGRALNFSEIGIITENVFGHTPKLLLKNWTSSHGLKQYPLNRTGPWHGDIKLEMPESKVAKDPKFGSGPPPKSMLAELDKLPHQKRRILSLIDIPLWDKANWSATMYAQDPRKDPPLLLGLGFKDSQAARAIFTAWIKRLGNSDTDDQLRVSIVTGVDKKNPSSYNVVIGTNIKTVTRDEDDKFFILVSRINQMTPQNSQNLDAFLASYSKFRRYLLAPVHFTDVTTFPTIHGDLGIEKISLNVRPAWMIGENDPDVTGIRPDDDPIIPAEVNDAPVLALLKRRKKREN